MKTLIIKITSAALLFGFVLSGCAEPRHYQGDRDDKARNQGDKHDNGHHDDNHSDNDHQDNH